MKKLNIDVIAATVPEQYGFHIAEKLKFSKSEFLILWYFAVMDASWITRDAQWCRDALVLISSRPKDALKLISAIRDRKSRQQNAIIRNTILDLRSNPPNWTLKDKEIARLICVKLNLKYKENGLQFANLTETIKKTRQSLAKKFPFTKTSIPFRVTKDR